MTGGFPSQRPATRKMFPFWWRHYVYHILDCILIFCLDRVHLTVVPMSTDVSSRYIWIQRISGEPSQHQPSQISSLGHHLSFFKQYRYTYFKLFNQCFYQRVLNNTLLIFNTIMNTTYVDKYAKCSLLFQKVQIYLLSIVRPTLLSARFEQHSVNF